MSGLYGMPGIGGGLGQCAVCGKSFVKEVLLGRLVRTIEIDGIDGELCIHDACLNRLALIRGKDWELLPDGPLREIYERAANAEDNQ